MMVTKFLSQRVILAVLVIAHTPVTAHAQPGSGAKPKACALLTRDLVEKIAAANKKSVTGGPKEMSLGSNGTACDWGQVTFQVDPSTASRVAEYAKSDSKNWEVIQGLGDGAYLHNVQNMMAELYVRVGARSFALLTEVPTGSTTAAFKPTLLAVAKEIVPKLR